MIKRLFDLLMAVLCLVILSVPLFIVASLVYIYIGRPVVYVQVRPGLHRNTFKMYKFRTMTDEVDSKGVLLADDLRLTSFGKLLRSTSLDELPGLWNVLKGDMSLVGPRPLLVEYLPLYSKEQARRHEIRPGITGWAQVNGRNAISWEEKFKLDVWYLDNRTFWLDIKILFLTVKKVFIRDGISADGEATMSKFTGSQN